MILSILELTLLKGDVSLIISFFDQWEPREIFLIGSVNKRLLNIVRCYVHKRWNIEGFVGTSFPKPSTLLNLLDKEGGVIFGPAVFRFFDRTLTCPTSLDICIHGRTLRKLLHLMNEEGYKLVGHKGRTSTPEHDILEKYSRMHAYDLRSSGERNQSEAHRAAWGPYEFTKDSQNKYGRIRLHIVRCEPYRHILSFYSTGLMNMIAWKQAISLFPKSTFAYRRSFVSAQDALIAKQNYSQYKTWFDDYAKTVGIRIIGLTHRRYSHVETGTRFVSDDACWIIPMHTESGTL
ncbi:hypothetical protein CVT26_015256 [Gymnopilus dilepis]|uniref:Uncharacterized protein n=1 Tax=Gymnopilus dilepis TaxID=231916 RepID=A0A409X406_9AGAR|nr:hypothetical protein CVT26_015256 [Gymnopilus dilepis]